MIEIDLTNAVKYDFTIPPMGDDRNTDIKITTNGRPFTPTTEGGKVYPQSTVLTVGEDSFNIKNFEYQPNGVDGDGYKTKYKSYFSTHIDSNTVYYSSGGNHGDGRYFAYSGSIDGRKYGAPDVDADLPYGNVLKHQFGRVYEQADLIKDQELIFSGAFNMKFDANTGTLFVQLEDDSYEDTGVALATGWQLMEYKLADDNTMYFRIDDQEYNSSTPIKFTNTGLTVHRPEQDNGETVLQRFNWYRGYGEIIPDWLRDEIIDVEDNLPDNLA